MVLGLGTVLPPRPAIRKTSGVQLPRVHSNNLISQAPAALSSVGRAVDTPTARHHSNFQPTCSDQSNVERSGQPEAPQQQPQQATGDSLHGKQQQHEGLQQPEREQQQQQREQQEGGQQGPHEQACQQHDQRQQQDQQQQHEQHQDGLQQPAADPPPGKQSERSKRRARTDASAPAAEPAKAGPKKQGRPSLKANAAATPAANSAALVATDGQEAGRGKQRRAAPNSPAQYADVVDRTVLVPGSVFFVKQRGAVYVGRVKKAERRRKVPSVVVQFQDDDSIYWFPVADVRAWMAAMVQKGTWAKYNPGVPPPVPQRESEGMMKDKDKETAAQALQSLSASLCSSGAGTACAQKQQRQQAVVSSGRQAGRKRTAPVGGSGGGSEAKREGALDIMVHAVDLHAGDSHPCV
ncbi:hypothetical protein D9Q98_005921 [Chlorella vulgaris]|uniref:Tudor domain-containing protein n=1 Tax=Chlorella vulgaris TaxID=3077 RepID=A0A9D4TWQ6_CHLVU|nr:hypothetical protein D9Q98_005921 [Chlorella vulgaris]